MPSYSPSESPTCLLLGLSPNSYRAFRNREESRFNSLTRQLQDEIEDQDDENDTGRQPYEDENENPWDCDDEDFDDYMSNEPEENGEDLDTDRISTNEGKTAHVNSEEDLMFHLDGVNSPKKNSFKSVNRPSGTNGTTRRIRRSNRSHRTSSSLLELPFWYRNESADHLAVIVQQYNKKLLKDEYISPCKHDPRRLPHFIGRIQRTPIKIGLCQSQFHTLDKIDIYQRDIRQCGSNTTKLSTSYVISNWNDDGIPTILEVIETDQLCTWRRKIIKRFPVSFIYCLPVFQSKTEFIYSVENEEHEVGYACQPWNYTAYLPPDLVKNPDCEDII